MSFLVHCLDLFNNYKIIHSAIGASQHGTHAACIYLFGYHIFYLSNIYQIFGRILQCQAINALLESLSCTLCVDFRFDNQSTV